jgi:hypothetical protein
MIRIAPCTLKISLILLAAGSALLSLPLRALEGPRFHQDLKPWQSQIVNEAKNLYDPMLIEQNKSPLEFEVLAHDASVVASVRNDGPAYVVTLFGGLLASERLNADGFRIVLCHELSHHFGGAPRRSAPPEWDGPKAPNGKSLTTSEAQADYAATQTCFRKLVAGQNHRELLSTEGLTPRAVALCDQVWGPESDDSFICQRSASGAYNLLRLVLDFQISFETPSKSEALMTEVESYPPRQCRLDTYLAGALCRDQMPLQLHFTDAKQSECQNPEGQRPRCWYKP